LVKQAFSSSLFYLHPGNVAKPLIKINGISSIISLFSAIPIIVSVVTKALVLISFSLVSVNFKVVSILRASSYTN
jgi:hypothetical protein